MKNRVWFKGLVLICFSTLVLMNVFSMSSRFADDDRVDSLFLNDRSYYDSVSVSLLSDSIPVDSVSVSLLSDSIPVDSVSVSLLSDTALVDSISNEISAAELRMQIKDETKVDRYEYFEKRILAQSEIDDLVCYYKMLLDRGQIIDAYEPWKAAFNGCENPTISMYNDGSAIINAKLINDTINKKYNDIGKYAKEIAELYEVAIANVDDLNSQVDFSRVSDSITVAMLRSRQLTFYDRYTEMDSAFNSNHHNNYLEQSTRTYWHDAHLHDSVEIYKLYSWLTDIVYSEELHITGEQLVDFSSICQLKVNRDMRKYNLKGDGVKYIKPLQQILLEDAEQCKARMLQLIEIERDSIQRKNFQIFLDEMIVRNFAMAEEGYITDDDPAKRVEIYNKRIQESGWNIDVVNDIIRNAVLRRSSDQPLYCEALMQKYQVEPSYKLALDIATRSAKLGKIQKSYYATSISYYKMLMEYDDFKSLSNFEQAKLHLSLATVQNTVNQNNAACASAFMAMSLCAEYPDIYYFLSRLIITANNKYPRLIMSFCYCIAYDYCNKALNLLSALSENNSEVTSSLTIADLNNWLEHYKSMFPSIDDVHNAGYNVTFQGQNIEFKPGKTLTLPRYGQKFKAEIRISK